MPRLVGAALMVGSAALMAQAPAPEIAPAALLGSTPTALLACPANGSGVLPVDQEATRQRLNQLAAFEAMCETNPGFHAYRGLLLLKAGWLAEAATALEKSLLLLPEQPGVQLDYAQVLAQLGQKNSARQLVEIVASREDIQPDLRDWLRAGLLPNTEVWTWASMLQSSVGRESNMSGATHTDSLTLFLPNGTVDVSLADSEKPVAGVGLKTMYALQGVRALGTGAMRVLLSVQARATQKVANNHLGEAQMSYAWPMGPGLATAQIATHYYEQISEYKYADTSWRLKYEPKALWNDCKWTPMLGQVNQRYLTTTNLSGLYGHAGLEMQCTHSASQETTLSFTGGLDEPSKGSRPGGNKKRQELTLSHFKAMRLPANDSSGFSGLFKAWYRQNNSQDQEIFSPLLGNQNIHTRRQDAGMGFWWSVAHQWSVGLDWEITSQKSSNSLSNIRNSSLYLGVKWGSKT